jgi:hypothetical protein
VPEGYRGEEEGEDSGIFVELKDIRPSSKASSVVCAAKRLRV